MRYDHLMVLRVFIISTMTMQSKLKIIGKYMCTLLRVPQGFELDVLRQSQGQPGLAEIFAPDGVTGRKYIVMVLKY